MSTRNNIIILTVVNNHKERRFCNLNATAVIYIFIIMIYTN